MDKQYEQTNYRRRNLNYELTYEKILNLTSLSQAVMEIKIKITMNVNLHLSDWQN